MSYPNSIFNNATPNPIENKANWLGRYLSVEKGFSSKLQKVLSEAAVNIDEYFGDLVNDNISTKVARVRIGLAHKEIRRQMREIFGTTGNLIKHHQQDAAVAAVNAKLYDEKGILSLLFPDPVDRSQYADSLRQTARRNIESTIVRAIFTEKPLSERVYRTEALANGLVSKTVNNALARGDSARNLAKDVRALIDPNVPGGVSYAAMRLGRTEINNAFHAQSIIDTQDSPWVHEMRWYLSKRHEKDPGDECETYAATGTFRKEDVPEKPHPNCFSGETLVTAKSVRSVSKRWYEGSFIDVFCAEDTPHLSGTPNHPALTKRGWVPLSELREGDYLAVNPLRDNASGFSVPNQDYVKTRIEDVFNSFRMSFGVTVISVPGTTEQFHGDGIIGENVDIVLTDSLLQNGWDSKGFSQGAFFGSGMALLNFFGFRSIDKTLISVGHSTSSNVSSQSPSFSLSRGHVSSNLSVVSELKSIGGEHLSQLHDAPSGRLTDLFGCESGEIEFVRVERILERPEGFRGHVYNLSTESGWYTVDHNTDSAVVSNCRCFVTPELPDYEDFERSLISGYYDPYLDSVMGQGYSEETRAKPISGQFAATKKKKPPAEPAKWTGPKVGKPLSNEPLVERNLEKAWQSTKFDDYKKNFRIGGREAQRIGYGKFPTFYKDEITERIQDGTIDNLLDSDPSVLKAYGKEIVARAVHSEPITKPIYRGMIIERADLLDSQVGRTVAMPLSSFDTEEHWAIDFAQGRAWQSEDVKKLKDPVPVLIQLEPGAKVANLKGSERVAFGQFDVEEILPPKDVKVIRLSQEEITERPTVLVVRQTSMLEPETIGGRMAEGKSNEEIDKEIKEFQVVDDASKMKGVRPNAATRQALSKLKEVLPKTKIVTAKASLNSTVLSEMATAYSELNEDFPEILDNYKALAFGDPGKGTFGETKSVNIDLPKEFKEVTGRGSTVIFNTENFASKKKLKESVAKTVFGDKKDEKYKPQQHQGVEVDPVKTVVVHEFGHQMAIALGWGNPKSIFSTFNQKLFDVYDKTVAKSDEDRTGEKLNAWLEKIISELPPYGSVIGSETGQPPLAWNEVDLNEAFPISFESARLRPEKAKFIEKLMHDFLVENYEKFIKGRKKENA